MVKLSRGENVLRRKCFAAILATASLPVAKLSHNDKFMRRNCPRRKFPWRDCPWRKFPRRDCPRRKFPRIDCSQLNSHAMKSSCGETVQGENSRKERLFKARIPAERLPRAKLSRGENSRGETVARRKFPPGDCPR